MPAWQQCDHIACALKRPKIVGHKTCNRCINKRYSLCNLSVHLFMLSISGSHNMLILSTYKKHLPMEQRSTLAMSLFSNSLLSNIRIFWSIVSGYRPQ